MLSRSVCYSAAQRATQGLFIDQTLRFIFYFRLGIFFWKFWKKEDILDWEWGLISDPGDKEKKALNN